MGNCLAKALVAYKVQLKSTKAMANTWVIGSIGRGSKTLIIQLGIIRLIGPL